MNRQLLLLGSSFTLLLACTHNPPTELVDARAVYDRAAEGPAKTFTPAELHVAKTSLDVAEKTFAHDNNTLLVRNLAYIAMRKAELAETLARTIKYERGLSESELREELLEDQDASRTKANLVDAKQALVDEEHAGAETSRELVAAKTAGAATEKELAAEKVARANADKRAAQSAADLAVGLGDVELVRASAGDLVAVGSAAALALALALADFVALASFGLAAGWVAGAAEDRERGERDRGHAALRGEVGHPGDHSMVCQGLARFRAWASVTSSQPQ